MGKTMQAVCAVALLLLAGCSEEAREFGRDLAREYLAAPPADPCAARAVPIDPAADLGTTMLTVTELARACLMSR